MTLHSHFSFTRLLRVLAASCMSILMAACGGLYGDDAAPQAGSPVVTIPPAGSPTVTTPQIVTQPWDGLFPSGSNSITLNAEQCTGATGGATTATLTITRGTKTFAVSIASGPTRWGPYTVGDKSDDWGYTFSVGTGTSTYIDINAYSSSVFSFRISNDQGSLQSIAFDNGPNDLISCAKITNPLVRAQLSLQPQTRLASFLAETPTGTVTSAISAPTGCSTINGTYTYAVSPRGVIQLDTQTLPANWLDTVNSAGGRYSESAFNYSPTQSSNFIYLNFDLYRAVTINRSIDSSTGSRFGHECGVRSA